MTIKDNQAVLTESERVLFAEMGAIGIMVFEGNRIAFITETKSTDYAETSYIKYAIGNPQNKQRKSRMYDTMDGTRFIINGKRYDRDLIQVL